jgi:integrase/recombinase XerD
MANVAPVLSEAQRQRVLRYLEITSFPRRNRIVMLLSWMAGMRVGEIAALNMGDVVDAEGNVRRELRLAATQTKGSKGRTVYVNTTLQIELEAYLRGCVRKHAAQDPFIASKTGKRFSANGLCQRVLQLYDAAGVDAATSHSGRRGFITALADKGINVRVIAELAGHSSIQTTQRYIELNERVLRQAVEAV